MTTGPITTVCDEESYDARDADHACAVDARRDRSAQRWSPSTRIAERFVILRTLGRDGLGEVFLAQDQELGRRVALTTVADSLDTPNHDVTSWLPIFQRDAAAMAQLNHPHIETLYHVGVHANIPFMVLEYVEGATLRHVLAERVPSPREALTWGFQIVDAMVHAHSKGVTHGALSLDSVMITRHKRVKLLDFDVALLGRSRAALHGTIACACCPHVTGSPLPVSQGTSTTTPVDLSIDGVGSDSIALGRVLQTLFEASIKHAETTQGPIPDAVHAVVARIKDHGSGGDAPVSIDELHALLDRAASGAVVSSVHNLTPYPGAWVGRTHLLAHLDQLMLHSTCRLINLVGPAGVGKTRLAIEWGLRHTFRFSRCLFVDLTEADDALALLAAVARALGTTLHEHHAETQLLNTLRAEGDLLLILDNCEQLVSPLTRILTSWLSGAPALRAILTSQRVLRIHAEHVVAVTPLDTDHYGASAVELFEQCARRRDPQWRCAEDQRDDVLALVQKLDGLPLAIELAAAHVATLTPREMMQRMSARFQLLRAPFDTVSSRHTALETALSVSWDLLEPWACSALAQASVFDGGFTFDAAETVIDLSAWPDHGWLLDVLDQLVDRCWLSTTMVDAQGQALNAPRFQMLSSIQAFAQDKLIDMSSTQLDHAALREACHARHVEFFSRACDAMPRNTFGNPIVSDDVSILSTNIDNLIAALTRCVAYDWHPQTFSIMLALCSLYEKQGPFAKAIQLLTSVIQNSSLLPEQRLRLLLARGKFQTRGLSYLDGQRDYKDALDLAKNLGHARFQAMASGNLAIVDFRLGRFSDARQYFEHALDLHTTLDEPVLEGTLRANLAVLDQAEGRLEQAFEECLRAVEIFKPLGDVFLASVYTGNLGLISKKMGRFDDARRYYAQAIELCRRANNLLSLSGNLGNLGVLLQDLGDLDAALIHLSEALDIARRVGVRRNIGVWLGHMGRIHAARHQSAPAREAFDEALDILDAIQDVSCEARVRCDMADFEYDLGNADRAYEHMRIAETRLRRTDDASMLALVLCRRGALDLRSQRHHDAREALDEVETIFTIPAFTRSQDIEQVYVALRDSLCGVQGGP